MSGAAEFHNGTDFEFVDVSTEQFRTYIFPGRQQVTIENPLFLNVSSTGGHRIFDGYKSHYIPPGWIHLEWVAKEGCPHFVK